MRERKGRERKEKKGKKARMGEGRGVREEWEGR